jgi:hypothetical protein
MKKITKESGNTEESNKIEKEFNNMIKEINTKKNKEQLDILDKFGTNIFTVGNKTI